MSKISNPRFPHTCKIYRKVIGGSPVNSDPNVDDDDEQAAEVVCYEGECRSYDHNTTSDRGEVLTQIRVLALPITQDAWTCGTVPRKGDAVEVDKGSFNEWGIVMDIRPGNLGTNVLWRYND